MKLVLDSNVLIAALIARGVCADLLEHCVLRHNIVCSDFILEEVRQKLVTKFKYSDEEADEAVLLFRSQCEFVQPSSLATRVCRDVDDDQILATAIAGQAQCIVSGDNDLLVLKQHAGIDIVRPSDFAAYELIGG
jgi:putative PIN family toxin of toxin-antitoxin system